MYRQHKKHHPICSTNSYIPTKNPSTKADGFLDTPSSFCY